MSFSHLYRENYFYKLLITKANLNSPFVMKTLKTVTESIFSTSNKLPLAIKKSISNLIQKPILLLSFFLITIASCTDSTCLDQTQKQKYIKDGAIIVSRARGYLNTELFRFLTEGDIKTAIVGGCRLGVMEAINNLAEEKNVEIKRITAQNGKQSASLSDYELKELREYQRLDRKKATPKAIKVENRVVFLSPIYNNSTCLKCHGEVGKTMEQETADFIDSLYPKNNVTGYKDGDFQGLWSVTFFDEKK